MINTLHIKNIGIIDDITVDLNEGFNVLTGETGAGKSLIIGSLQILAGGRFSKEIIRHRKKSAFVEASFFIPNKDFEDDTNSDASEENISVNENDERINISPKLKEAHKHESITITSMNITSITGTDYAKVGLNIRNDGEYIPGFGMLVTFYKKDGSVLSEVYMSSPSITPNEVVYVEEDVFQRVIDAYDYSFIYFIVDDEGGGGL